MPVMAGSRSTIMSPSGHCAVSPLHAKIFCSLDPMPAASVPQSSTPCWKAPNSMALTRKPGSAT